MGDFVKVKIVTGDDEAANRNTLKISGELYDRISCVRTRFANNTWIESKHTIAEFKALLLICKGFKDELAVLRSYTTATLNPIVLEFLQNLIEITEGLVNDSIKCNYTEKEKLNYWIEVPLKPEDSSNPQVLSQMAIISKLYAAEKEIFDLKLRKHLEPMQPLKTDNKVVPADVVVVDQVAPAAVTVQSTTKNTQKKCVIM